MRQARIWLALRLFKAMMIVAPKGTGGLFVHQTGDDMNQIHVMKRLPNTALRFAVEEWLE